MALMYFTRGVNVPAVRGCASITKVAKDDTS
jgi:hypothetical protein